jgi:hypothetical protein
MGDMRKTYKILVGKPKGQRPLRRARNRWEDNSKMYLKYVRWEGVDCIPLGQVRAWCQTCKHDNEPSGTTKGREFLE